MHRPDSPSTQLQMHTTQYNCHAPSTSQNVAIYFAVFLSRMSIAVESVKIAQFRSDVK